MGRPISIIHASIFVVFLVAWTIALLSPVPHESAERTLGGAFWVFLFGKGLHISVYAFLAVLGGTVALFGRKRQLVFPALVLHGAAIEFFQPFVGRTGSIRDVLLDALGIAIGYGLVAAWRGIAKRKAKGEASSLESTASLDPGRPHSHPTTPTNPSRTAADD